MTFARRVFTLAGVYGLIVLLPLYALEDKISQYAPPAIRHPEYFYGFIGVAVAWQVAFLIIGRDPARYRPLMIAAMIEKATFVIAVAALYSLRRVEMPTVITAGADLLLGVLFFVAYLKTRQSTPA